MISTPYQSHSATSAEAAERAEPRAGTDRGVILDCFREFGDFTDEELVRLLKMNPSTVRPRRIELVRGGLIEDSGETRRTMSGRKATVWVLARNA